LRSNWKQKDTIGLKKQQRLLNTEEMSAVLSESNSVATIVASVEKNIDSGAPLAQLRKSALAAFQKLGLPIGKNEEYKHTPVTRALEKNFNFGLANAPSVGVHLSDVLIPGVKGNILVFINGKFSREHSSIISPSSSIEIQTLQEAVMTKKETVLQHLGKIADFSTDAFCAWNTASWNDGLFIQVADHKVIDEPVVIYHIHDTKGGQIISANRNLVLLGKNSELTVIEKYDSSGSGNGFSSQVTEATLADNSSLNWFTIQNDKGNRFQFDHKQFQQSRSSRVNTYTFTLDGKVVRNNLQLALDGEGIDSHMYGLYLIGKDTLADNHTVVDHRQPNSFSNELYKGIIDDSAKGVFNGKIYVRPNAQKTNAFQANRNILLTGKASVNTKPQLEIWADDVKCSHGCTTGQLDEEALFYLRTRGISKETARAMVLYAFAGELLDTVKNTAFRTYLDNLISARLHKNF
jgi:Fe-S cluster assembly protein SufD